MKTPSILLLGLLVLTGCNSFSAATKNAQGVDLFERAKFAEAERAFQSALEIDSRNADAYYNLGSTYHRVGMIHRDSNYLARAEECYHLAIDHSADHSDAYRGLAVLLVESGRYDSAVRLLQGWSDRNPVSAEPRIQLARIFDEARQPQLAMEQLLTAARIAPNDSRVYAAMGYLRERQGDNALAIQNYQQSMALRAKQPELAQRLALLQNSYGPTSVAMRPNADGSTPAPTTTPSTDADAANFYDSQAGSTRPLDVLVPLLPSSPSYSRSASNGLGSNRF